MENPLAPPPPGSEALEIFLRHFRLARSQPPEELVGQAARAFSRIPYENLTKIVKLSEAGSPEKARRGPREVLADHLVYGAGGTCFSLTAAFLHILRALGWRAEPILADRRYGPNTHCALLVWIGGEPHLLDPGFLLVSPIPLSASPEIRLETAFNQVILTPEKGGARIDLHTVQKGNRTYRLTYKSEPVDAGEFLKAWDASFGWEMMRYPVLTRVRGREQVYLQENKFQVRSAESIARQEFPPATLLQKIHAEFGIDRSVIARALRVLENKGRR